MLRSIALLLTIPTGFTGLVYEVTWQKYLATLLGSHSEATASVLAIFLGGLSVGYALFGRVAQRHVARARARGQSPRLLILYAVVEIAIGVYALCFPVLFGVVQELSYRLPQESFIGSFVTDVGLSALLVAPPTVLMGATIPLLTQALARGIEDATRFHAWVYAFNTAGAFGGALAAGFVLIPLLGLAPVMWSMSAINILVGALFLVLGRRGDAAGVPVQEDAAPPVRGVGDLYVVALLVGFGMMAVQTVVIRVGGLSFGSSEFVFSTVVAVFVLCIAIGSSAVSLLSARIRPFHVWAVAWALVAILAVLYPNIGDMPYWAHRLRVNFPSQISAFLPFYLSGFGALLLVLGPAVVCSGALLPLLFHCLRGQVGDLGAVAGRLYAWNTVGSLLGALLGGYLLLFWLNLDDVFRVAIASLVASAAWLVVRVSGRPLALGAGLAAAGLAGVALLPDWSAHMLSVGLFRKRVESPVTYAGPTAARRSAALTTKMLFYTDGPSSSVAIEEGLSRTGELSRHIKTNGKSDGSTVMDYATMSLAGIVPALLADNPRSSFVIGFGTGVTAGALGRVPTMERVLVAEISHGVIEGAPIFDPDNHGVTQDPRIEIIRSDAYRALMRSDEQFDVIVSEPSNPWVAGVEMLFSKEFLEVAKDRLSPGGVYAQWFHQYETDSESVAIVLRTYAEVFDSVALWYGVGADLILLGFKDGRRETDLAQIEARMQDPELRDELARSQIENIQELAAHEIWPIGVLKSLELEGPVHRLQHPILSHQAGRGFFVGGLGSLPFASVGKPVAVAHMNSLVHRLLARAPEEERDAVWAAFAEETCFHRTSRCVAVLARWKLDVPQSEFRDELVERAAETGSRMGLALNRSDLAKVAALLDPEGSRSRRPLEPTEAKEFHRIFIRYSQADLPLPPERLLDAWERCTPRPSCPDCCANGAAGTRGLFERVGLPVREGSTQPPDGGTPSG